MFHHLSMLSFAVLFLLRLCTCFAPCLHISLHFSIFHIRYRQRRAGSYKWSLCALVCIPSDLDFAVINLYMASWHFPLISWCLLGFACELSPVRGAIWEGVGTFQIGMSPEEVDEWYCFLKGPVLSPVLSCSCFPLLSGYHEASNSSSRLLLPYACLTSS